MDERHLRSDAMKIFMAKAHGGSSRPLLQQYQADLLLCGLLLSSLTLQPLWEEWMLRAALNSLREPYERVVSQSPPAAAMAQLLAEAQAVRSANPRPGTQVGRGADQGHTHKVGACRGEGWVNRKLGLGISHVIKCRIRRSCDGESQRTSDGARATVRPTVKVPLEPCKTERFQVLAKQNVSRLLWMNKTARLTRQNCNPEPSRNIQNYNRSLSMIRDQIVDDRSYMI